ncbi:GAF domain-containing protein [Sphingomicrobium astaxanthinifaciens]|uniref:GAF domain-containing protein n=1 Tax=Sphingomicrobium astaxanthinifaciens TaxID=1227949 RepID=UPI001FCC72A9|nr:GAF domain-containing protein [Sphingomicrobium astaxanthinifaciens]MCJ7421950.1 GAF domain-containing protein [Sphingomicrobium astaxanthinifaciens]
MIADCHPEQEQRLRALRRYGVLDTPREKEFDDIVALVSTFCEAPVSVVNFIDAERQWFKAETGLGVRSTPLDTSLCSHVILEDDFVEIPDTLSDPRMADNPLCIGDGGFRFYAGALLKSSEGLPLGTLCVLDTRPRTLDRQQRELVRVLAERVMRELELRLQLERESLLKREIDHRAKNSLSMMHALIHMEQRQSAHPETRSALASVAARLSALGAVHEAMTVADSDHLVGLAGMMGKIEAGLRQLLPESIGLDLRVDEIEIDTGRANALALVVNEFVANSAKHAFDGRADGHIAIRLRALDEARLMLCCEDDGIATADVTDRLASASGIGTKVIDTLAASLGDRARWGYADPGVRLEIGPVPIR